MSESLAGPKGLMSLKVPRETKRVSRPTAFKQIRKASLPDQAFAYAVHDNRETMCREFWDLYPDGKTLRRFVASCLMIEVTRIWNQTIPPFGSYPDVGRAEV